MTAVDSFALALEDNTIAALAAHFAATGRARIAPALPPAQADALFRHLDREAAWSRALNRDNRTWDLGPDAIKRLERDGDTKLLEIVHRQARDGFQFLFDRVRIDDAPAERRKRGSTLDRLLDGLNTPCALDLFRSLVGDSTIARVDGQATRYLPGHFLTAHDDAVDGKGRVAAYVLSLTPSWRTEWGGLLQFHGPDADIAEAWAPAFNTIHLFRVPQVHSVSYVVPFAGAPRYSITGWLRRT